MIEWLILQLIVLVISIVLIFLWGRSENGRGKSEERRRSAESQLDRVGTAMETLTATPPNRAGLLRDWMQRIRKAGGE